MIQLFSKTYPQQKAYIQNLSAFKAKSIYKCMYVKCPRKKKVLIYSFFNLRKALSPSVSMGKNTSKKNVTKNENLVLKLCNF